MSKLNKVSLSICFLGLTLAIVFIILLKEIDRTLINILSIIGTIASLVGLGINYIQLREVKNISEANNKVIKETKESINYVLLLSDSGSVSHLIGDVQGYLREDKLELALVKMKDLKKYLISFKHLEKFKKNNSNSKISSNLTNLSTHINNISDNLSIKATNIKIDISTINRDLEIL